MKAAESVGGKYFHQGTWASCPSSCGMKRQQTRGDVTRYDIRPKHQWTGDKNKKT